MLIYIVFLVVLKMDKFEVNDLLDFYDVLLTDKQLNICNLYYREDLSLQEISENLNISRSGVFDTIKRCETILLDYENKLKLSDNHQKRMVLYKQIKEYNKNDVDIINDIVDKLINTEYREVNDE